jgi:hypothetical protein
MSQLPLAEIERVYAVRHKEILIIFAEGFVSSTEGSLHICRSRTKIFPPLFEIFENPEGEPAASRIPAVAANAFPGMFSKIQIVCANDRIFPKIMAAIEEPESSGADAAAGAAPESAPGIEQWIAIHEFTPLGPPKLRVEGNTLIPNLGVAPKLVRAEAQGSDPKILSLNVINEPLTNVQGDLRPRPVRTRVRYEEETDYPFESVQIDSIQKIIGIENIRHQTTK